MISSGRASTPGTRVRRGRYGVLGLLVVIGAGLLAAGPGAAAPSQAGPARVYQAHGLHAVTGWRSLAVTSRARPPAKRGVVYGGITGQHDPLVITLSKDGSRVTRVIQEWEARMTDGSGYLFAENLPAPPVQVSGANGRFGFTIMETENLGGGDTGKVSYTISAKVAGKKMTGTLTTHADVVNAANAVVASSDLKTKFTLVSAKGREFGGATAQNMPVLVELTARGNKVNHFHIGWWGRSTPGGVFQYGETLTTFPLTKKGVFGDIWTDRYTEPTGEFELQDFAVQGKVSGAKASGHFRTTLTWFEGSGAASGSCTSGSVSWRATSG
jgi:hypothetical protein